MRVCVHVRELKRAYLCLCVCDSINTVTEKEEEK